MPVTDYWNTCGDYHDTPYTDIHIAHPTLWTFQLQGLDYNALKSQAELFDLGVKGRGGMACLPTQCFDRHSKNWIGFVRDFMDNQGTFDGERFGQEDRYYELWLAAHELGHQIGSLWPPFENVDIFPNENESYWQDQFATYGDYARSIMYYKKDAAYFDVDHLVILRGYMNCEEHY